MKGIAIECISAKKKLYFLFCVFPEIHAELSVSSCILYASFFSSVL